MNKNNALLFLLSILLATSQTVGQTIPPISFTFSMKDSARTSAGVFAKDGALLRTLWNGVTYKPGSYTQTWDGKDDEGRLLPNDTYDLRVMSNKVAYTWEGSIGNTSKAWADSTRFRGMEKMFCMAITGSTAYFGVNYNEQLGSSYKLNLSNPQAKTDVLGKGARVRLVATDGNRVYWGGEDPNNGINSFVFVTNVSNDAEATLEKATPYQTIFGRRYTSAISVLSDSGSFITGLAVQKKGNYLFISRQKMNRIYVVNKNTGATSATVNLDAPREIALDDDDNLWIISGKNSLAKYRVNIDGSLTPANLAVSGLIDPLAVAVAPGKGMLLVADAGSSQQLKAFSTTTGGNVWTYGKPGGYAVDPVVSNDKFYFSDLKGGRYPSTQTGKQIVTFIAFQPDGSFWVDDWGNSRVQHFSASLSYIDRIMFLPSSVNCNVDGNNPTRLFSDYLEFKIDYSIPLGPDNNSWTLVNNWGATVPADYDDDWTHLKFVATLSNGRTYAVLNYLPKTQYEVVELPAGKPMRFTGQRLPDFMHQLYPDGSIRSVSLWQTGSPTVWKRQDLTGFDGQGNPLWGLEKTVVASPPVRGSDPVFVGNINTLTAGEVTSSNILISFDAGKPANWHQQSGGYHLGGIRVGESKWLWRAAPSTSKNYVGDYPTDGAFDIGNGVEYAGSRAYALGRNIIWGYYGEMWKQRATNKWQHVYDNGLLVGHFGPTAMDQLELYKIFPGIAGNASSGAVTQSPVDPNTMYLYHNDESYYSGVHRWKISGLNTIQEQRIPVSLQATKRGLLGDYFDGRDLNNFNRKTTRLDSTVNVNWQGSVPGTTLTNPSLFSTRWQGFVLPTYTGAYTFYLDLDSKARLWIDGALVIDQWTNTAQKQAASSAVSLEAGKRYTLRLEYASNSSNARVGLWWASSQQPKQIIPYSNLFAAEADNPAVDVDLLKHLSPGSIMEQSLYGWTRYWPYEDYTNYFQKWWSVQTAVKSYGRFRSPDVQVKFKQPYGIFSISRDLGSNTDLISWRVNGKLNFADHTGNRTNGSVSFFTILDDKDKILVRLFFVDTYPIYTLYANNRVLATLTVSQMQRVLWSSQPLDILMANGRVTVKYGSYPEVNTSIMEADGNWQRPKSLRLSFVAKNDTRDHTIDLDGMTFSRTRPVGALRLKADDTDNTLAATDDVADADIMVSENGGAYTPYTGQIAVGNQNRPSGYWQFKTIGGNERATVQASPAFNAERPASAPLTIYPNPVQQTLYVQYPDPAGLKVVNVKTVGGRELKRWVSGPGEAGSSFDVGSLPTGQYVLQCSSGTTQASATFVKQ